MSDAKAIEDILMREYRAMFARADWHTVKSYLLMLTKIYTINKRILQKLAVEKMHEEIKRRGG